MRVYKSRTYVYCLRNQKFRHCDSRIKNKPVAERNDTKQHNVTQLHALTVVRVPDAAGTRHGECSISSNERFCAGPHGSATVRPAREKATRPGSAACGRFSQSRAKGCVCVSPSERVSSARAVQFSQQSVLPHRQQQQQPTVSSPPAQPRGGSMAP
jgi:hypothetical protein